MPSAVGYVAIFYLQLPLLRAALTVEMSLTKLMNKHTQNTLLLFIFIDLSREPFCRRTPGGNDTTISIQVNKSVFRL